MVVRNNRDHHAQQFHQAGFRTLCGREWNFAGAKIAAAFGNLLDAFARSDGKVAKLKGGVSFVVLGRPAVVERSGNAGAGADENNRVLSEARPERENGGKKNRRQHEHQIDLD